MKSILVIFGTILLIGATGVKAQEIPNFSTCPTPGGNIIASYDTGTHAIAGDPITHNGSDYVYQLTNTTVTQCYCPVTGVDGIQTDWFDASGLSQDEIDSLKNSGWIYIPNGLSWGLNDAPYLAKNISFACGNVATATPSPSPSPVPTEPGSPIVTPSPNPTPTPSILGSSTTSDPGAPQCSAQTPPDPKILTAIRLNPTTEKITWTSVTPVTYYTISYGPSANNLIYGVPNTGNQTSFVIGALKPGEDYVFVAHAVNDCAPSDPSIPSNGNSGGQVLGASTSKLADTSGEQTLPRSILAVLVGFATLLISI